MLLGTFMVLFVLRVAAEIAVPPPARTIGCQPTNQCCRSKPRNCADLYKSGVDTDGVYHVYPLREDQPAAVFCDMTSEGGGWSVFQKRFNGEVDFYRGWQDYKNGFGCVFREYWWGNDKLHQITSQEPQHLRIDLSDFSGQTRYAKYSFFGVADDAGKYRASVGGYSGDAGDAFADASDTIWVNGMRFSTKDADHDTRRALSCAQEYKGAWWYSACHRSNLNGLYRRGGTTTAYADSMSWKPWRGYHYSLKTSEMKIRPANF